MPRTPLEPNVCYSHKIEDAETQTVLSVEITPDRHGLSVEVEGYLPIIIDLSGAHLRVLQDPDGDEPIELVYVNSAPVHKGCECALCSNLIESEDDGESTPSGSMHTWCAVIHENKHSDEW